MTGATGDAPGRDDAGYCCDEWQSAVEVTFAAPVQGPTGWLLYGTDAESVSGGDPALRYWAARFCPFCGARLRPYTGTLPRARAFGFGNDANMGHETPGDGGETQS